MKYMCRKCGGSDPCFIDFGDAPAPEYCPCDGERVVWREVTEPAALPKLTVEDSKPQLPDWLKLGAWAAVGKFVGKIDWISRAVPECRITCGESRFAKRDEVKPVTWRAWTFEEAELQVGKAFRFKKTGYIGVMLGSHKDRGVAFPASGEHHNVYFSSLDELFEQGEQLSGLPCGVPQVDGKDLEIRPCD